MKKQANEFFLMHKDIMVCLMEISVDGAIGNVRRNEKNMAHFPLGGQMNNMKFHEWWRDRAIPRTRHGAGTALQKLGYSSTGSALVDNLALSLTDCYWIKPRDEDIAWKDVSLFSNEFVDTFGEISINQDYVVDLRNVTRFNCATSRGELQKKWGIGDDGRRYMVKGNYGQSYQQSINEVFASRLHLQQGYDRYTAYTLTKLRLEDDREGIGCMCYDFCGEHAESISAWELLQTVKTKSNESLYYPFREVCLKMGMRPDDFDAFMDYQIMTDYLITNTDRHMNNIAVMRDPDTLELLGFAPVFDSGNSMFYDLSFDELAIVRLNKIKTHSFVEREKALLKYVKDRTVVDLDRADMDFGIYENDITERHCRIPRMKELYERKLGVLRMFRDGSDVWK